MRIEAGSLFAGYTVVEQLGRGGMATVYLVREPGIDRLVALKVLPEQLANDTRFAERFEQEARVIGRLDHPNIIPLYRYGITNDVPWMALRYVNGGDFAARLGAYPLPVPEGLSLLRGIAAALDYAHRNSVIHRDLKPQNILLTSDGAAYLADFGIAKLLEGAVRLETVPGSVMGTPAYMAPEQAQGLPLGPFTDTYALAVICFQWLTGSLPFDADTPYAILIKHVTEPLPAEKLALLSPNVAALLERGLAKRPTDRIQSAGVLIAELERALSNSVPQFAPTSRRRDAPSAQDIHASREIVESRRSNSLWKAIAATVLALTLIVSGYKIWRVQTAMETTPKSMAKDVRSVDQADSDARSKPKTEDFETERAQLPEAGSKTKHLASQLLNNGFVDEGGGVLQETASGLEWTQYDNGSDINWNNAKRYCEKKGSGWRLPSIAELKSLQHGENPVGVPCGETYNGIDPNPQTLNCKVPTLFRLTGSRFWSGEQANALAWNVIFNVYLQHRDHTDYGRDLRTLCVRLFIVHH